MTKTKVTKAWNIGLVVATIVAFLGVLKRRRSNRMITEG